MDLLMWLMTHKAWSANTFGYAPRAQGLLKHIRKELDEIERAPRDLEEWLDVAILAFDGAWRAGYTPSQICEGLQHKLEVNCGRTWSKGVAEDEPAEHLRG